MASKNTIIMAIHEQGHYGKYSGNARCCAHTRVDAHNYKATERDDAAHIVALEKDMKYDKDHHGPGKLEDLDGSGDVTKKDFLIGAGVLNADGFKVDGPAKRYCIK